MFLLLKLLKTSVCFNVDTFFFIWQIFVSFTSALMMSIKAEFTCLGCSKFILGMERGGLGYWGSLRAEAGGLGYWDSLREVAEGLG